MNCPKKKFSPQEDALLIKLVEKNGACKWDTIALSMNGRKGRQCRDRYMNYLNPAVKRDEWTLEEDMLLIEKVKEHGPKWAKISKFFEGRTGPALKNRWNYKLSRIENKNFHTMLNSDLKSEEEGSEPQRNQQTNIDYIYQNSHNARNKKPKSACSSSNGYSNNNHESSNIHEKKDKQISFLKPPTTNLDKEPNIGKLNKIDDGKHNFVHDTVIEEIFGHLSKEDEIGLIFDCYDCFLGRENIATYFET